MSDLNHTVISGRLVKDPNIRSTPSGAKVCDVLIANNRWVPNRNEENGRTRHTTFTKVTLWNEKAEHAGEHFHKGDKILVVGKLVDDNYKIKDSDQMTRGRLKIDQVESIQLIHPTSKSFEPMTGSVDTL